MLCEQILNTHVYFQLNKDEVCQLVIFHKVISFLVFAVTQSCDISQGHFVIFHKVVSLVILPNKHFHRF